MPVPGIRIRGAREHNLKDISLEIPRNKLVVITGLSGSGKSSLAFDTIFAEGQRRYVESLSAYARQFLGQMDKPDVDAIDGLSPAISIDQKTTSRNPRSTVGTVTEIHDYLRLLWARAGHPHCPICDRQIAAQSPEQIAEQILGLDEGTKIIVLAPIVRARKGEHQQLLDRLRQEGFVRVEIDGQIFGLEEEIRLDKQKRHDISVVVDRLKIRPGLRRRMTEACETAGQLSGGLVEIEEEGGSRQLFSESFTCPEHGATLPELEPRVFSFNSPHGACSHCTGLGAQLEIDPRLVVPDESRSLADGAIAPWAESSSSFSERMLPALIDHLGVDEDAAWSDLPATARQQILYGTDEPVVISYEGRYGVRHHHSSFEGVIGRLRRRYRSTSSDWLRARIERYMAEAPCPECQGARLSPAARAVRVAGRGIDQISAMTVDEAVAWFADLELSEGESQIARPILREVEGRLGFLRDVGLGYLSLDRASGTLSGGEAQRIRLATQIGSALVGVLYVLDEPSIGLHQRDNDRLLATLERLRDLGNTVLVVEHDEQTMRAADQIIDLGPGAGEHGGELVAQGTAAQIMRKRRSLTGAFLAGRRQIPVPETRRPSESELVVRGAQEHNLCDIDVRIPLGVLSCVTGVSGSGKSTLVGDILVPALEMRLHRGLRRAGQHRRIDGLEHLDKLIVVDQAPIGRTPRSNPATYIGLFDGIRDLFSKTQEAKARGYKPGRFSFNVRGGRCETCQGDGQITIQMHFLPDVYVPCEACHGARYNRETLEVRWRGKTIAEVLAMSSEDALEFFAAIPPLKRRLQALCDVGLGYVRLGQPATTLSGGEAQRVKLAAELSKVATGRTLYVLDEPTTGLHFADTERLITILQRLVDAGNSVLVIEHNLDVIKTADHIIDLGPEGGAGGGRIVAAGTPEKVAKIRGSHTGQHLRPLL